MASLAGSLARGVLAGVAGTTAMTAVQLAVRKARGEPLGTRVPRTWAEAPAPAQVAKKAAERLGHGRRITKKDVPLLTEAMHWGYGVAWGLAYGALAHGRRPGPLTGGLTLGAGVWAASYAELVPLGVYEPPWHYPPPELALDLGYHLAYGLGAAAAYAALER